MDISPDILIYFLDGLIQEGFYLVLICLFIGYVIKHQIPAIKNEYIPLITAIVGGVVGIFIFNGAVGVNIIKGIALGWASTGMYETIKNLILNRVEEEQRRNNKELDS